MLPTLQRAFPREWSHQTDGDRPDEYDRDLVSENCQRAVGDISRQVSKSEKYLAELLDFAFEYAALR
jgi:hypothetical protein